VKDILAKSMGIINPLKISWEIQEIIFNRSEHSPRSHKEIVATVLKLQAKTVVLCALETLLE